MTSITSTKRLSALLLVAGLTFGAAACGSSESSDESTDTTEKTDETSETTEEDTGTDEVAFDDWADEVSAACVDLDDATGAVEEPDTEDGDELADALGEVSGAFDDFVATLEDAGTPDENADEAAEYLDLATQTQEIIAEAADTAADDPVQALRLMDDIGKINDEAAAVAEDLGLDDCVHTTEELSTSKYDRQETIDNLTTDAGLTGEQAICVVDFLEEEVGTDALDEAVNSEPDPSSGPSSDDAADLPPEIQDALTDAVSECVFTE
jgi:hypothetical protein